MSSLPPVMETLHLDVPGRLPGAWGSKGLGLEGASSHHISAVSRICCSASWVQRPGPMQTVWRFSPSRQHARGSFSHAKHCRGSREQSSGCAKAWGSLSFSQAVTQSQSHVQWELSVQSGFVQCPARGAWHRRGTVRCYSCASS